VAEGGRELLATGITRSTRLSRIAASGDVVDFGRSFEGLESGLAGSDGNVYAVAQLATAPGNTWVIHRLEPVEAGQRQASPSAATPASTGAPPRPQRAPRIAFTVESFSSGRGRIVTLRADGRGGVRQLVPGGFNHGFCQSANGRKMAYFSDAEAPHENFIYLANADGSERQKITEEQVGFWCGFSERWLLLTKQTGTALTLIRHDLRTGAEKEFARNVDRLALSPDGNRLVYVGGLDFSSGTPPRGRETLELLDLTTLARRMLAGPSPNGIYHGLTWSPDGKQIAYATHPYRDPPGVSLAEKRPPAARTVEVRDASSGALARRLRITGGPPGLSWSPDGTKLLVCMPASGNEIGCSGGFPYAKLQARLLLVDVSSGTQRVVTRGKLIWAGWSPTGGYGYATNDAVFVVSPEGRVRKLANGPRRTIAGTWLGFSPDGRYIGLGDFASRLAVLDLQTGKVNILARETTRQFLSYRKWWR
jgi:dipeptidyl aminopeptidase/acylaminoacyl peptidase